MDEVIRTGPLFDGRASAEAVRAAAAIEAAVAKQAESRIRARLGDVLQHPTGYYQGHIHTERAVTDLVVTDTPVVYGPWLEGVGSRNYPRTRFRGYSTFRLVSQKLDADAGGLAEAELVQGGYLERMGGVPL